MTSSTEHLEVSKASHSLCLFQHSGDCDIRKIEGDSSCDYASLTCYYSQQSHKFGQNWK